MCASFKYIGRLAIAGFFTLIFCAFVFGMDHETGGFIQALDIKYWGSYLLYGIPMLLMLILLQQLMVQIPLKLYFPLVGVFAFLVTTLLAVLVTPKPHALGFLALAIAVFIYLGFYSLILLWLRNWN